MLTIIHVTFDAKKKLVFKYQAGSHEFENDEFPHTIIWKLVGNLQGGSFRQLRTPVAGFAWDPVELQPNKQQPAAGIFSEPVIGKHNKTMWMYNYDPDEQSGGEWSYSLGVDAGEALYRTAPPKKRKSRPPGTRTSNDPIIINKKSRQ